MFRRIVAGVLLGALVLTAASVVSHGLKHPGFLQPEIHPESMIVAGPGSRH